jgi:hypothetical protein
VVYKSNRLGTAIILYHAKPNTADFFPFSCAVREHWACCWICDLSFFFALTCSGPKAETISLHVSTYDGTIMRQAHQHQLRPSGQKKSQATFIIMVFRLKYLYMGFSTGSTCTMWCKNCCILDNAKALWPAKPFDQHAMPSILLRMIAHKRHPMRFPHPAWHAKEERGIIPINLFTTVAQHSIGITQYSHCAILGQNSYAALGCSSTYSYGA